MSDLIERAFGSSFRPEPLADERTLENLGNVFAQSVMFDTRHLATADWHYLHRAADPQEQTDTTAYEEQLQDRSHYVDDFFLRRDLLLSGVGVVCDFPQPDNAAAAILTGFVTGMSIALKPKDIFTPMVEAVSSYAERPAARSGAFFSQLAQTAFAETIGGQISHRKLLNHIANTRPSV